MVPFKEKLEILLSSSEVNSFDNQNNRKLLLSKSIKSNVADGSYIKTRANIDSNKEKEIIMLAFYYDDIEIVNPIGNSRKKHKLGNFKLSKKLSIE